MTNTRIEVIGHGGAAAFYASNSERSLKQAMSIGVDRIECDIRLTADGHLVLVHDDSLQVAKKKKTPVRSLGLARIQELDPGVLTLGQAASIVDNRIPFLLDIKDLGSQHELIGAIRDLGLAHTSSCSSTHARSLRAMRQAFPSMRIGLSRGHSLTRIGQSHLRRSSAHVLAIGQAPSLTALARWCGATEVMLQHHLCTPPMARALSMAGLPVYAWTVNRPNDIRRMLAMNVAGIISDRPDLVLSLLE